jgi:hypothetical protein
MLGAPITSKYAILFGRAEGACSGCQALPAIMTKRQRPHQSEPDAGDDAVTERVKRLAIESRAGSPSLIPYGDVSTFVPDATQSHAQTGHAYSIVDEMDFATNYRDQALRLRELHFERLQRANLEKHHEKQNASCNGNSRCPDSAA